MSGPDNIASTLLVLFDGSIPDFGQAERKHLIFYFQEAACEAVDTTIIEFVGHDTRIIQRAVDETFDTVLGTARCICAALGLGNDDSFADQVTDAIGKAMVQRLSAVSEHVGRA